MGSVLASRRQESGASRTSASPKRASGLTNPEISACLCRWINRAFVLPEGRAVLVPQADSLSEVPR